MTLRRFTPVAAHADADARYRRIAATLFGGGEPIEIRVPEDIQVEGGRLIEIREGEDGEYYFESLIPE